MLLTEKEKRVLRFLATSFRDFSINEVARACRLAPSGAHKVLKKLEKEGVMKAKSFANIVSYTVDFGGDKTESVLHIAFVPEKLEGRIKLRAEDVKPLKACTLACIMFGSYTTGKQKPGDLDLLFVLERKHFAAYKQGLAKVKDITPLRIQDIIQTADDLVENLRKEDPVVVDAVRNGLVLWGFDVLILVIRNAITGQAEELP